MSNDWTRDHGSLPPGWQPQRTELELHRYALKCVGQYAGNGRAKCEAVSPWSDPVNFEIGGAKQAQALAEEQGWANVRTVVRYGVEVPSNDGIPHWFCPVCKPRSK